MLLIDCCSALCCLCCAVCAVLSVLCCLCCAAVCTVLSVPCCAVCVVLSVLSVSCRPCRAVCAVLSLLCCMCRTICTVLSVPCCMCCLCCVHPHSYSPIYYKLTPPYHMIKHKISLILIPPTENPKTVPQSSSYWTHADKQPLLWTWLLVKELKMFHCIQTQSLYSAIWKTYTSWELLRRWRMFFELMV